jgi:hypothetical protein
VAERIKVTEAVRLTGVPGTAIFLAIRHGEITSERDDRGFDLVDPDESPPSPSPAEVAAGEPPGGRQSSRMKVTSMFTW